MISAEALARWKAEAMEANAVDLGHTWLWRGISLIEDLQAQQQAIEELADWLARERDSIREAYRQHNAHRKEGRPAVRPDLGGWGNGYEVAERKVRALLPEPRVRYECGCISCGPKCECDGACSQGRNLDTRPAKEDGESHVAE